MTQRIKTKIKEEQLKYSASEIADAVTRTNKVTKKPLGKLTYKKGKTHADLTIALKKGTHARLKMIRETLPIIKEMDITIKDRPAVSMYVDTTTELPFVQENTNFHPAKTYFKILDNLKDAEREKNVPKKVEMLNTTLKNLSASLAIGAISFHDWLHIARQISPTMEHSNMATSPFWLLSGKALDDKNADTKEIANVLKQRKLINFTKPYTTPEGRKKIQCCLCKKNLPKCKALRPQNAGAVWTGYTIDMEKTAAGTLEFRARLIEKTSEQRMAETLAQAGERGFHKKDNMIKDLLAGKPVQFGL